MATSLNGKKIEQRPGHDFSFPVKASTAINQGALAMLASGLLVPAAAQGSSGAAALCKVVGIAKQRIAGGGADGAVKGPVNRGVFLFKNSASGDLIALSDVGSPAYVVDDETVAKTSASSVRPAAGTIVDVESAGVWVRVGV